MYMYWLSFAVILFTNFLISIELAYALINYLKILYQRNTKVRPSTTPNIINKESFLTEKQDRTDSFDINIGVIIPAYLPNEYSVLKNTLNSYLNQTYKYGKILIVIVCNGESPSNDYVNELKHILKDNHLFTFDMIYLSSSTSKAENVNHGIDLLIGKTDYIAIFDADHQPDANAFNLAVNILYYNLGYYTPSSDISPDMVQGRCLIRDNQFIGMEMQEIYLIHHWAGSDVRKFSLFGGSNAFWKAKVLQEIRMDKNMLTEDIDAGIRAWLKGYNLIFCPGIISYELAPKTIKSLYYQRLRWAQGWLQVTLKYTMQILRSDKQLWQKIVMFLLLPYREFHHYLSLNVITAFLSYYIRTGLIDMELIKYNSILLIFEGMKILILVLGGYLSKAGINLKQVLLYIILVIPYEIFKHVITLEAHIRNMRQINSWIVTAR